jgi:hypothetical protein
VDVAESVVVESAPQDLSAEISATLESLLEAMPDDGPETGQSTEVEPKTAQTNQETVTAPVAKTAGDEAKTIGEAKPEEATRGAERIAAREAQIAEKEKAIREREKELATIASRMRRGEVVDALKAIGFEDREIPLVTRAIMASQLPPEKVPEAYRQHAKELSTEERYRAMIAEAAETAKAAKAELEQYKEQVAQQQYVQQYQAQAEDYFSKSAATEVPTFTRLLQADRNEAMKRFYAVVQADAQAKLAKGEPAQAMSPAEAAKAVEAELSKIASLIATTKTNTPTAKTAATGNPSPSLSTKTVPPTRNPSATEAVDITVDRYLREHGLA